MQEVPAPDTTIGPLHSVESGDPAALLLHSWLGAGREARVSLPGRDRVIARLKTVTGRPEDVDAGRRIFEEVALPCAQAQEGFRGGWFLVDRESGVTITLTLWDHEQAWRAARECLRRRVEDEPARRAELERINAGDVTFGGFEIAAGSGPPSA